MGIRNGGKKSMILQPSCSEAIARINLKNLTDSELVELEDLLKRLEEDEENWFETSWDKKDIFGSSIIEISGDTPYNNSRWLEEQLRNLKFGANLEIEFDS